MRLLYATGSNEMEIREKKKAQLCFLNCSFVHFRDIKCLVPEFNPCSVSSLFTGKKAHVLRVYNDGGHHVSRHHVWCENALIKHFLFVTLIYQDSFPPWFHIERFHPDSSLSGNIRHHEPLTTPPKKYVQVLFKPYFNLIF